MSTWDYHALDPPPRPWSTAVKYAAVFCLTIICLRPYLFGLLGRSSPVSRSNANYISFSPSDNSKDKPIQQLPFRPALNGGNFSFDSKDASKVKELSGVMGCSELAIKQMARLDPALLNRPIESVEKQLRELQAMTGLNESEVCKVVVGLPRVLGWNAEHMRTKMEELAAMTGTTPVEIAKMVSRTPQLLSLNVDSMRQKIADLAAMTGSNEKKAMSMVASFPVIISYNADTLRSKINEIAGLIGISRKDAGKLCATYPRVLAHSTESMKIKLQEMCVLMDLGSAEISKLAAKCPSLLGFNGDSMRKKLQDIADMTNSSYEGAVSMAVAFPRVLSYNTDSMKVKVEALRDSMKVKVEALREVFDYSANEVGQLLRRHPALLSAPPDLAKTRTERLAELLQLHGPLAVEQPSPARHTQAMLQARRMIRSYPQVLTYSFEKNLEPTLKFLLENTAVTCEEIMNHVCLLGYSLAKRIKPRYYFTVRHQVALTGSMIKLTDAKFLGQKVGGVNFTEYKDFKTEFLKTPHASESAALAQTDTDANDSDDDHC
eukprot:g71257.t1